MGIFMDVPKSRRDVMTGIESMVEEWLQNHPAPSWKLVAWALYRSENGKVTQHNVLKQLYGKYVTGMWLCTEIISGTIVEYNTVTVLSNAKTMCVHVRDLNLGPVSRIRVLRWRE